MKRARWNFWPVAIFTVIVVCFLAATGIVQWRIQVLTSAAADIANTTAPSVEYLGAARAETRSLQIVLQRRASAVEDVRQQGPALKHARQAVDTAVKMYLVLPVAAGERALWADLFRAREALDDALTRFEVEVGRGDDVAARSTLAVEVPAAATRLDDAITRALDFNTARSRNLTREVDLLKDRALAIAVGLDVLCTGIAIAGAVLLRRIVVDHESLLERHLALQKERASELEEFAGRVAHDILSPLSTVGFALQLAAQPGREDERVRFTSRGVAALQRVKTIVNGLLDFARAGAAPDADAHTPVAGVMKDLEEELEPAATAAGVELTMTEEGACEVECNAGVLTSLIANLTRNAIKYIGDGPVRRVDVRAFERGAFVRVEVADTGPGLPPDVENRVFDAHARARNATQPGIGLGLATVKRLAEAHGGSVGVTSVLGRGCTFWFELPSARRVAGPVERPEARSRATAWN